MLFLSSLIAVLAALLSSLPLSEAALVKHDASFTPDYILSVTQTNAALACVYRPSLVVNGSTPGPVIRLTEGKTTWIRVHNNVPNQNLTIHWHGLSESTAPFSDGTPRASQWPIASNHFFDYELRPNVGQAGTYFYHSHVGFQAVSAAGPLIVEEASGSPPYSYDEEQIFFLTELYNRTDTQIENGLVADPFTWSGEAERVLVNGKGTKAISANASQVTDPDPPPQSGSPSCGPEVFHVKPDTTYRFRFVSAAALSLLTLAFEGHRNLTIIEADGSYTQPYCTNHLQLGSGQRFDVLLHTKTAQELKAAAKKEFYIQIEIRDRPINLTSYALLSYTNSAPTVPVPPKQPPLTLPQSVSSWLEYALEPLEPNNFPSAAEVTRRVYLSNKQFSPPNISYWDVNHHQWTAERPGKPYLVRIYEHGQTAIPDLQTAEKYGGWDPRTDTYPAEVGEVVEIILLNDANSGGTNDVHPWHAHGGHYYDIGSGPGMYDAAANEKRLKGYNPVKRDTTILYKQDGGATAVTKPNSVTGWRGWRLRVEDAGVWMIHCHTLQHMLMGLQTVWIMGNASQITSKGLAESKGYLTYGGNVYGNDTYSPTVNHYFDD